MSGMNLDHLSSSDQFVVSAFQNSLRTQVLIVCGGILVLALILVLRRWWRPLAGHGPGDTDDAVAPVPAPRDRAARLGDWAEPRARRVVRIGFGLLWLVDAVLQAQSRMPLGLPSSVVSPSEAGSPGWLRQIVNFGATVWEKHPVAVAVAAVWIQIGVGLWLLLVAGGRWSRLGGLLSVGWALTVWLFGETLGGLLAPGVSWMFGAPGAVVLYAAAGALIALPPRSWDGPKLALRWLRALGLLLIALAVAQALPGDGFWVSGNANALASMVTRMAQTPQPAGLASALRAFAHFDAANAVAVNAFVIASLAAIGGALLVGRARWVRIVVAYAAVLFLADWVLVQDLGVFGGTGTDPNSMIPLLLLLVGGYCALVEPGPRGETVRAARRAPSSLGALVRDLAAVTAAALFALGAVPFALAAAEPNATPLLAQTIDGPPTRIPGDFRPGNFTLLDQYDRPVSLRGLRGKVLLVTFLDPVCTTDCPIIAQEFRIADRLLGGLSRRAELIAINTNPTYRSPSVLEAFDRQEDLQHIPNWLYLTGSLSELRRVWNTFGVQVDALPAGAMIAHSEQANIVDQAGRLSWEMDLDPGPATTPTQSSFAVTLADAARATIRHGA